MEQRGPVVDDALAGVLAVGRVATVLAAAPRAYDALPAALHELVASLGLDSAVLRAGGDLLAVGGDVVRAVPDRRDVRPLSPTGSLDVPVRRGEVEVAVLVVTGARPSHLPVLRAAATVLALALSDRSGRSGGAAEVEARLVDDAEVDRDELADALHDGPVQALLVARYAADAAVRAGDPSGSAGLARDAVQDAVVEVRRAMWQLRPRGASDLVAALSELSARRVERGAAPLDLTGGPGPDDPRVRVASYRLVQAVAAGDGPVRVRLGADAVEVHGGRALDDPDRWRRRSEALGARLETRPGLVRLHLPRTTHIPDPRPKATS